MKYQYCLTLHVYLFINTYLPVAWRAQRQADTRTEASGMFIATTKTNISQCSGHLLAT